MFLINAIDGHDPAVSCHVLGAVYDPGSYFLLIDKLRVLDVKHRALIQIDNMSFLVQSPILEPRIHRV